MHQSPYDNPTLEPARDGLLARGREVIYNATLTARGAATILAIFAFFVGLIYGLIPAIIAAAGAFLTMLVLGLIFNPATGILRFTLRAVITYTLIGLGFYIAFTQLT